MGNKMTEPKVGKWPAFLMLILCLAIFLRFYAIGQESLWIDEGASAMTMKLYTGMETLKNIYLYGQTLPGLYPGISDLPVYHPTLYYWTRIFGVSEAGLRSYSAIYGILALIPTFLLARELFGRKIANIAAFLMAINVSAIYYAQEARPYSLVLFFGISSIYFFYMALQKNTGYYWAWFVAFALLGLYTHFLFEILVIFECAYLALHLIWIRQKKIREIITEIFSWKKGLARNAGVALLLIFILSLPLVVRTFREGNAEDWRGKPSVGTIARFFVKFVGWIQPTDAVRESLSSGDYAGIGFWPLLAFIGLFGALAVSYFAVGSAIISGESGIACLFRDSKSSRKNMNAKLLGDWARQNEAIVFSALCFAFPVLFSLLLSYLTPIPIFGPFNYLIYCLPVFLILVAKGISNSKMNLPGKYGMSWMLLLLIVLSLPVVIDYYNGPNRQQWREVSQYLQENAADKEPILVSLYSGAVTLEYYNGDNPHIFGVKDAGQAGEILQAADSGWLALSFWQYGDPEGTIRKKVEERFELGERIRFYDIDLYHIKRR
ncbi:MAG: glycosyl transferase family protein [archaeon GW2011_AR3]|nr:MAG: glycosyl transferase family protein [archaeon GW2011_AR3]